MLIINDLWGGYTAKGPYFGCRYEFSVNVGRPFGSLNTPTRFTFPLAKMPNFKLYACSHSLLLNLFVNFHKVLGLRFRIFEKSVSGVILDSFQKPFPLSVIWRVSAPFFCKCSLEIFTSLRIFDGILNGFLQEPVELGFPFAESKRRDGVQLFST